MLLNMLKRGCFAHLKEKMIMKCWLDQYLENILLEDLKHAKGYPLCCGWPLFNQWGQGSKVELVLYCDSHIFIKFVVQTSDLKDGYFAGNWRDTLCFWLKLAHMGRSKENKQNGTWNTVPEWRWTCQSGS